jgi:multiple sugar transport system ATP-binding protein
MAAVRLEAVSKIFAGGHVGVEALDLEVASGELVVLVGPSGCGKSTALRLVAGLETVTQGRVWLGDREVTTVPPQERDVAMVFQSYALYPHKTVRENLAFALRLRRVPRDEIGTRIDEAARRLGLHGLLERRPAQLSGGQRQRVALGRALVRQPRAFLLDEPLSNLDAGLRTRTRTEIARLHRELDATMLYVTHDQEEAMTLGDRIAVMKDGRLHQVARPLEVYERPADAFVAGFVGSPAMNFLPASLGRALVTGRPLRLGIRPQAVELLPAHDPTRDARGRVEVVERLGSELRVHLRLEDGAELVACAAPTGEPQLDETLGLRFPRERLHRFDPETGARVEG